MGIETKTEQWKLPFPFIDEMAKTCPVGEPDGIVVLLHDPQGVVIGARRVNVWKAARGGTNRQGKPKPQAHVMEIGSMFGGGDPLCSTPKGRLVLVKASAYIAKTLPVSAPQTSSIKGPDDFGDNE